jgi:hypothetical protein
MKMQDVRIVRYALIVVTVLLIANPFGLAQNTADGNAVSVPPLVRFSGVLKDAAGRPPTGTVGVIFALYKDQEGGAPLWLETQNVQADSKGNYTVLLGSSKPAGLPVDLFSSNQARWLGVQISGQTDQPRVLLLSVPYALKAHDSETLGGKPASAFAAASSPNAKSNVNAPGTITGAGTKGHLPKFTGATTIGNSRVFQSAAGNVGIGTTSPATALDVEGTGGFRDSLTLFPNGSHPTLSIQGTAFAVSSTGLVTFVSGQTFPGTGTITGVSAGTDLTGGGNSGNITLNVDTTKVAQLNTSNNGTLSVTGNNSGTIVQATQNNSASGAAIAGVAGGSNGIGVQGSGFTGVSGFGLGANGTGISGTGGGAGVLGVTAGTSSSAAGVSGQATASSGGATGVIGESASGIGVFGGSNATSGVTYGVQGINHNPTQFAAGVEGESFATKGVTFGLVGSVSSPNGIGAVALADGESSIGLRLIGCCPVGVWGDTASNLGGAAGLVGTADDARAIYLENNSPSGVPTAFMQQDAAGELALMAGGAGGFCTINTDGHLFCPNALSVLAPVDTGQRHVALYAMESPQNWFEDFDSGQLTSGTSRIALDATFAEASNPGVQYHVFLTPRDECEGLYVSNATTSGFEVHELHHGQSNVAFDYRIVALRRGFEDVRLQDMSDQWKKMSVPMPRPASTQRLAAAAPIVPLKSNLASPVRLSAQR